MSRLYWLLHPPAGVGLAIVAALTVAGLENHYRDTKCSNAAAGDQCENAPQDRSPAVIAPVVSDESPIAEPNPSREEWRSEQDLQAQKDMAKWAKLMLLMSAGGLVIGAAGLLWIKRTFDASNASVQAATVANNLTREILIADQRAWLKVKLVVESDLVFSRDGGFELGVALRIKNIGRTPALDAHTSMKMTVERGPIEDRLRALCTVAHDEIDNTASRMVLPGESYRRQWGPTANPNEIASSTLGFSIYPRIFGCVTYRILPDRSIHQTAFVYDLWEKDSEGNFADSFRDGVSRRKEIVACEVGTGGFAD